MSEKSKNTPLCYRPSGKVVYEVLGSHIPKEKVVAELYSLIKRTHNEASNSSNAKFYFKVILQEQTP